MPCTNCTQTTATVTGFNPSNCTSTNPCFLDAGCVVYTGPALNCSGIATNDALDTILQKIDPLLCASTGDYSTYNTYCLAPITTQKQFVETISNFVCTLQTSFNTFTGTTFPAYQTTINGRLTALEVPGITCSTAGVVNTDTLQTVLNKYCTKFGAIDASLNISSANWSQCYTVSPAPTTPTQGFDIIIDQICLLKAAVESGSASLPTFNNVGSCLAAPVTTADSLVDTVNKIKTRLCQTGTLDTTTLSWGCVTQPSGSQNLQDTLQNLITTLSTVARSLPTSWSGDFTIGNVDNSNLCLGKTVALSSPPTRDRFVAVTASDTNPGVLEDKLIPGTNMSLDYITSPGFVIINSTGGTGTGDHKVASDAADPSPDYLSQKILTGVPNNGVSIIPSLDETNHVVRLNAQVDPGVLFGAILDELADNPALFTRLCNAIAGCPSPCAAPSNVTVVYQQGTTTTTTSTTTTTTTT